MARRTSIAEPAPASHPDRDGIEPWHSASVGPVSPGVDSTPFPKVGCWRRVRNQEGILAFHPREAFAPVHREPVGPGRVRFSPRDQRAQRHHLEVADLDALESRQIFVVLARVGSAADEPVAAVVGQDHAVGLQGLEDHARQGGYLRALQDALSRTRIPIGGRSVSVKWLAK